MPSLDADIPVFTVKPGGDGKISAQMLDDCWRNNLELQFSSDAILDLSQSNYLTHDCLFFLGAFGRSRSWKGSTTRVRLAPNKRLFDFLRSWRFFDFLTVACDQTLEETLTRDSANFLAGLTSPPRYVQMIKTPTGGYESLLLREQFEITPIDLEVHPLRAASYLRDRWLEVHLVGILELLLKRDDRKKIDGRRVATHIVLEMVVNAASHPGANIAFLSSQIDPPSDGRGRQLRLSVWDDGLSMADTLSHALRETGSIQSPAYGGVEEVFEVVLNGHRGSGANLRIESTQRELPDDPTLLNILAFMLGVSARPHEKRPHWVHKGLIADAPGFLAEGMFDHGGLGLYLVRTTAVNLFEGSITYKTGSYRYKIEAGVRPNTYQVTANIAEDQACPLKGNLLEISLPLGDR